jgi:predicted RNA binding protein YcfA (HicA-like mRNA interferase family)
LKYQPNKLPILSWKQVTKILDRLGYQYKHGKGSHMFFSDGIHKVSVPRHDEIAPGTLLSIIEQTGLTKQEFLNILKEI